MLRKGGLGGYLMESGWGVISGRGKALTLCQYRRLGL